MNREGLKRLSICFSIMALTLIMGSFEVFADGEVENDIQEKIHIGLNDNAENSFSIQEDEPEMLAEGMSSSMTLKLEDSEVEGHEDVNVDQVDDDILVEMKELDLNSKAKTMETRRCKRSVSGVKRITYQYDDCQRLTRCSNGSSYNYDANGNVRVKARK